MLSTEWMAPAHWARTTGRKLSILTKRGSRRTGPTPVSMLLHHALKLHCMGSNQLKTSGLQSLAHQQHHQQQDRGKKRSAMQQTGCINLLQHQQHSNLCSIAAQACAQHQRPPHHASATSSSHISLERLLSRLFPPCTSRPCRRRCRGQPAGHYYVHKFSVVHASLSCPLPLGLRRQPSSRVVPAPRPQPPALSRLLPRGQRKSSRC